MKKSQAKGYLLEIVLSKLLEVNGYNVVVTTGYDIIKLGHGLNVKGRGGVHQFDSLGTFRITPPFVYPIRLFVEAKFYSAPDEELKLPNYNYHYVIFSTSGFTEPAQKMAIAHKIYLVDLSGGRYAWIRDFVNQIVDRLFSNNNNTQNINKEIFDKFKRTFKSSIDALDETELEPFVDNQFMQELLNEFFNNLGHMGSMYMANTGNSQVIALLPEDDVIFRRSLQMNPHQEVTITWNLEDQNTWLVNPVNENQGWSLSFQLPSIVSRYIFNSSDGMLNRALHEKRYSLKSLAFIAYLDNQNPTLCTLNFNEIETSRFVERYNQQLRLDNRFDD